MHNNQTLKPRCPVCNSELISIGDRLDCPQSIGCGWPGANVALPRSSDTEPPKLRPCEFYTGEWRPALFVQYYTLQEELEHWNIVAIVQVEEHQEYVPLNWFHFTDRAAAVTDTKEKEQL